MPRLIDIDGEKGFHGLEVLVPVLVPVLEILLGWIVVPPPPYGK